MFMMEECKKLYRPGDPTTSDLGIDIKFVYNSFSGFVHRYLTNFYEEDEFYSL